MLTVVLHLVNMNFKDILLYVIKHVIWYRPCFLSKGGRIGPKSKAKDQFYDCPRGQITRPISNHLFKLVYDYLVLYLITIKYHTKYNFDLFIRLERKCTSSTRRVKVLVKIAALLKRVATFIKFTIKWHASRNMVWRH